MSYPYQQSEIELAVMAELKKAMKKFPKFNSAHEGYAVLKEEVDELWDVIKLKGSTPRMMEGEAIQVAAMAMRFLHDVCGMEILD